jgi:glycopeptide antibiotics resistance protein
MWWKLWLIGIVIILGFTIMPWTNYVGHSHWDLVRWLPFYDHPLVLSDVLGNVVLFVPFGLFLGRALPRSSPRRVWLLTLLTAVALSTSVEFFQVYCHNRHPSTTDIGTNLLGAVFGVMLSKLH